MTVKSSSNDLSEPVRTAPKGELTFQDLWSAFVEALAHVYAAIKWCLIHLYLLLEWLVVHTYLFCKWLLTEASDVLTHIYRTFPVWSRELMLTSEALLSALGSTFHGQVLIGPISILSTVKAFGERDLQILLHAFAWFFSIAGIVSLSLRRRDILNRLTLAALLLVLEQKAIVGLWQSKGHTFYSHELKVFLFSTLHFLLYWWVISFFAVRLSGFVRVRIARPWHRLGKWVLHHLFTGPRIILRRVQRAGAGFFASLQNFNYGFAYSTSPGSRPFRVRPKPFRPGQTFRKPWSHFAKRFSTAPRQGELIRGPLEHYTVLNAYLRKPASDVFIVSGYISNKQIHHELNGIVPALWEAQRKGTQIHIYVPIDHYDIRHTKELRADVCSAFQAIEFLTTEFTNIAVTWITKFHSKALWVDDELYVGSFNWLSAERDPLKAKIDHSTYSSGAKARENIQLLQEDIQRSLASPSLVNEIIADYQQKVQDELKRKEQKKREEEQRRRKEEQRKKEEEQRERERQREREDEQQRRDEQRRRQEKKRAEQQDPLAESLSYMGFTSMPREEQLKRRFWQLAHEHHPDRGGSHDSFVTLHFHYERILQSLA